jgi:hypothetical protein
VDEWKLKVHEKLKQMTPEQRAAFWRQIHEQARARGLHAAKPPTKPKQPVKRAGRTG